MRTPRAATQPAHCCGAPRHYCDTPCTLLRHAPPQPALRLRWDLLADYPVLRDFLRSPVWPDGIKFE